MRIKMASKLDRREFLGSIGIGAATFITSKIGGCTAASQPSADISSPGPNILWISAEDISPDLGCYGDDYAITPNIDTFAKTATRFDRAFTTAGVCAPVRSGVITGMYTTGIGTNNMRSNGVPPIGVKCFPEYLRAAGYYCTNRSKTDYQFKPPITAWDDSGSKAHWRNRPKDKPFFSIINLTTSHESQIRSKNKNLLDRIQKLGDQKHDPAKANVPPYYPDTKIVRGDLAQYADVVTLMDKQVGQILAELKADGLIENTIVFFWGDHGRGLCRGKRWIYDSGTLIPLIIHVPDKYRLFAGSSKPGSINGELISSVDFGPTVLSLAGVQIPKHINGKAFMGPQKTPEREYVFAARDRMDEAYDCIRTVRDKRYRYIRNFMPHLTYAQDIDYMNQMPSMKQMRQLNDEGKLTGAQKQYFRTEKPIEELFDTKTDPHEINNIAADPANKKIIRNMRKELYKWMRDIGDVGLIPEPDFDQLKRPDEIMQTTSAPGITLSKSGSTATARITCLTQGVSIAYKVDKGQWLLYSKPVTLKEGQKLTTKACRLGFKDSEEVTVDNNSKSTLPEKINSNSDHWRSKLDNSDMLDELLKFKQLDFKGEKAIPEYFKALNHNYSHIRYWAILGLHYCLKDADDITRAVKSFDSLLNDDSASVRVSAAEAIMDFLPNSRALDILVTSLKNGTEKERLFAAISLKRLGEKARPALAALKAAEKDSSGYVWRVCKYAVEKLE